MTKIRRFRSETYSCARKTSIGPLMPYMFSFLLNKILFYVLSASPNVYSNLVIYEMKLIQMCKSTITLMQLPASLISCLLPVSNNCIVTIHNVADFTFPITRTSGSTYPSLLLSIKNKTHWIERAIIWLMYIFLKKWAKPGLFSVYFRSFSQHKDKYSTNFTKNDKSIDGVLGSRTWGGMMEGADESTELWRHPHILWLFQFNEFYS